MATMPESNLGHNHWWAAFLLSFDQWPVSRKSRKLFGPGKTFLKLRLAHSVKLVFSYVVKGRKIKITAKFRALRRLRFEDTKRTMSPEMRPKSFGTFEKRAPGPQGIRCTLDFGKRISKHLSVKHLFETQGFAFGSGYV